MRLRARNYPEFVSPLAFVFVAAVLLGAQPCHAQWLSNGTPLATVPYNQLYPALAPDGAGGAIVTWMDARTSTGLPLKFDIYARRVSATGFPLWTDDGVPVCTLAGGDSNPVIVSDGLGGAIITWIRNTGAPGLYYDVYAQRINSNGNPVWTTNGLLLNTQSGFQSYPTLVSDGSGGAIITWFDNYDIYARRIAADGSSPWIPAAIAVATVGREYEPSIISDGIGGAIIAWPDSISSASNYDIYAQRITSAGTKAWATNGVPICTAPHAQLYVSIFSDGAGGGIVTWSDYRGSASDVYMQRVTISGSVQWGANGIPVCDVAGYEGNQAYAKVSDGFIVAWNDNRNGQDEEDVYAQHFDMLGTELWGHNGIPVCTAADIQSSPRLTADGAGGVYIAWSDLRTGDFDVYAQHVNNIGNMLWNTNGQVVASAIWTQGAGGMISDGKGGAILGWNDDRNSVDADIYVQHLGPYGPTVTDVGDSHPGATLAIRPNYPNPFNGHTSVDIQLSMQGTVAVEIFDVSGRRLRFDRMSLPSGWNHLEITDQGAHGTALPSGVYFLRVSTDHESATHKIIVTH